MTLHAHAFFLLAETTWIVRLQERALAISLLAGLAIVVILLGVTLVTRWGQSRALANCVILSIVAHVLLMILAYGTRLLDGGVTPPGQGGEMRLSLVEEGADGASSTEPAEAQPWDEAEIADSAEPPLPVPELIQPEIEPLRPDPIEGEVVAPPSESLAERMAESSVELPRLDAQTFADAVANLDQATPTTPRPPASSAPAPSMIVPPALLTPPTTPARNVAEARPPVPPLMPELPRWEPARPPLAELPPRTLESVEAMELPTPDAFAARPNESDLAAALPELPPLPTPTMPTEAVSTPAATLLERFGNELPARRLGDGEMLPEPYRWRVSPNRAAIAAASGGSVETEQAIQRALDWLASVQERDGSWSARRFGAGEERRILGHDREGSGAKADVGVTGLALLAFLGAGHTQMEGERRQTVEAGLGYLVRTQGSDGSLHGDAARFERTYCHGMAAMALSEALGMTGDARLRPAVEKAVLYTLTSQHPLGGWRYQPGQLGDMSQFGWQVMALKNADYAGVPTPAANVEKMKSFLRSVSSGQHQGLSRYREGEAPSRTMTAESWWCRYLLNTDLEAAAREEGFDYLMQELPSRESKPNYYYWYYATLALHRSGDARFGTWSAALAPAVLERQETTGAYGGSWAADCIWGGYGGRIYTTAMATLCLETFYRYRPSASSESVAAEPGGALGR